MLNDKTYLSWSEMPPENSGDTDKASRRKDQVHSKVVPGQKASEAEEGERKLQIRMEQENERRRKVHGRP